MQKKINRNWLWIAMVLVGIVGLVLAVPRLLPPPGAPANAGELSVAEEITATVTIRSADAVNGAIRSSGTVVFGDMLPVVIDVDGTVTALSVNVGDRVAVGDPLVGIDTIALERAVARARLEVESAQNQLDQLRDPASTEELAEAEANLASTQASLEAVKDGPSEAELVAAQANLAAAQAKYTDVTAELSADEETQLKANLEKAQVNLERAQRAYDKIKWAGDVGARQESADLQNATIEYEAAQAEYALAAEPASNADVQSAVSSIREAQRQLDDLLSQPDASDIASAEAQVAGAQAQLNDLHSGADELEIKAAEIQLEQALVSLEEAMVELRSAEVAAPITGVVTAVDTAVGETVRAGTVVVTLADPQDLAVQVEIAEVDVGKVTERQHATVSLDAFPGRSIDAEVERIAPTSTASDGAVNYQVDIQLIATDLAGIRPGMTAVATLDNTGATGEWLVPANAVKAQAGRTIVMVERSGGYVDVDVRADGLQGEWQLVSAEGLHPGDQVVGSVTSQLDDGEDFPGGGFPPRPSSPGGMAP